MCVRLSVSLFCYQARSLSSKINDMPDEFHNFQVAAMWDDVACWCVCVSVPKLECLVGLCRALLTHSLVLNQLGEDVRKTSRNAKKNQSGEILFSKDRKLLEIV